MSYEISRAIIYYPTPAGYNVYFSELVKFIFSPQIAELIQVFLVWALYTYPRASYIQNSVKMDKGFSYLELTF